MRELERCHGTAKSSGLKVCFFRRSISSSTTATGNGTSKAARVRFAGGKTTVIDGPFAETKELIAGFWIWQVKSLEEAIEWVKRCPNPNTGTPEERAKFGEESEIEIRPFYELEDFGEAVTPEVRAHEEKLRKEIERQQRQ